MRRTTLWLLALALAGPHAAFSAWAQTRYLTAEPPRPGSGTEIAAGLMTGSPFDDARPVVTGREEVRLERLWRSGRVELEPAAADGTATFLPDEPGVQLLSFAPRSEAQDAGSYGKALVVVGPASPGESIWRSELGHRLEIVPETDPAALAAAGGKLRIQVLFRREPLAGATVVAVAEEAPAESYRRAVTDGMGRARFTLDRPGRWLVHLAHKSAARSDGSGWSVYESSLLLSNGP